MASFFHASTFSMHGVRRDRATVVPNPEKERDAALVRRFNAGDQNAFAEIITGYRRKIFLTAFSVLRNEGDAEEIVQDTFLRAHRGLASFRGDSSLSTWLHSIAFNLSRNRYWYFRRRHRHKTQSFNSALNDENEATLADVIASTEPNPAREVTTQEFVEQVAVCMSELSADHRDILTMRNILDRPYEEIAHTLGLNVGTVKSRIARARDQLRGLLSEKYAGVVSNDLLSFQRPETS